MDAALQEARRVDGRVGTGTFVADGGVSYPSATSIREVERRIEELGRVAADAGLSRAELAYRVSTAHAKVARVRVLMLGTFHDATEAYADEIRPNVRPDEEIILARTTEQLAADRPPGTDLVATPRILRVDAQTLFPGLPVVGISLIPNEATRVGLAKIPSQAGVAALSYFPELLSVMRARCALPPTSLGSRVQSAAKRGCTTCLPAPRS